MRARFVLGGFLVLLFVTLIGVVFWKRVATPLPADSGKLQVVTSFLPLYSLTAQIAGDDAEVKNLLPNGVGPHDYSFTPADIETLGRADVVVINGLGLDDWVREAAAAAGNVEQAFVVASKGVEIKVPRALPTVGDPAEADPDERGSVDPHIWLDPVRAAQMAETIGAALVEADPAHARRYMERTDAVVEALNALDRDIRNTVAALPSKKFVAFHGAFGYVAERYGLEQVAVITTSPGTQPSPRAITEIVDLIRSQNITAIFSEPQFSPASVELIARETGQATYVLDTMETGPFLPDAYERIMRNNLANIAAAFSLP